MAKTVPFKAVEDHIHTAPCALQARQPEFSILYQHLKLVSAQLSLLAGIHRGPEQLEVNMEFSRQAQTSWGKEQLR